MPTTTTICGHCGVRISAGHLCADCSSTPLPRLSAFAALERTWPLVIAASRRCCLTARDSTVLEAMLSRPGGPDGHVRSLLQAKLENASVVLTADVDPALVTLESRVCFRLAGDPAAERVVTAWEEAQTVGLSLGVATPLGAALLGMRAGEPGWVLPRHGIARSIEVLEVAYQPEAARRQARREQPGKDRGEDAIVPLRPARRRTGSGTPGGDDPGPDAA